MDLSNIKLSIIVVSIALLAGCIEGEQGPQGEPGEMGEMGAPGEPGKDGEDGEDANASWRLKSIAECAATLDLIAAVNDGIEVGEDGVNETGLRATVKNYTNGDVEASCLVAIGSGQGGSSTSYHVSGTTGALNRACGVVAEYPLEDSGSAGSWRFRGVGGVMQAQYADSGNPLSGTTYEFTADNCIAKVLGEDGTWSDGELSEVLQ